MLFAAEDYALFEVEGEYNEIVGMFAMERPQLSINENQQPNVYVCYAESSTSFFVVEQHDVDRYFR